MIIASAKRKENIAEYLLYMWQIEDLIRANGMDISRIERNIIDRYGIDGCRRKEMTDWYDSLIDMMRREDVVDKGHLQINRNVIIQLARLHDSLLKDPKFAGYTAEFYKTLPYIVELRAKSGDDKPGEIETCFNALYGVLMLRIDGKEISEETAAAVTQISKFLALLAHYFKLDEADKLFKNDE